MAGGQLELTASVEQPRPARGLGYWPAFWALGSPRRAGGNYPDGECHCATPAAATSPAAAMSVAYVAGYEEGGNTTPRGRAVETGEVRGVRGDCLASRGALNAAGNPIGVHACDGDAGQAWPAYSDHTIRVQGGCLDVAGGAAQRWTWTAA